MSTAQVETESGKIHVVRVGKRRLTKSMFQQLDVHPRGTSIFHAIARVRSGLRERDYGYPGRGVPAFEFVGTDDDGNLVRHADMGYYCSDKQAAEYRLLPLVVL